MGITNTAYITGWLITAYIRIILVDIFYYNSKAFTVFEIAFFVFSILLKYDWNEFYNYDFLTMLIPFFIYGIAVKLTPF